MFLEKTIEKNKALVEAAFTLHQKGLITPDTYIIDLDRTVENARKIKEEADKYGVKLYFMAKQFGRNPEVCKEFMKLGYDGAVVVDFKEAETMIDNGIKIGHVGHLVQIPKSLLKKIIASNPEYITVYSIEKAKEIDKVCKELNVKQKVMLRILGSEDSLYSGQYGGFYIDELKDVVSKLIKLDNLLISGITSFPCFLYDGKENKINPTKNINTIKEAKVILESEFNIKIEQLNMPSATCTETIEQIYNNCGTHGEPGHGLTGTTPYHKYNDCVEVPSIIYLSEVSHNLDNKAYCYGGGHYRRSNMENGLVGRSFEESKLVKVVPPTMESIDYHFEIEENCNISDTVIMAFRAQVFVTRSNVAIVKGLTSGNASIIGLYDSQGKKLY